MMCEALLCRSIMRANQGPFLEIVLIGINLQAYRVRLRNGVSSVQLNRYRTNILSFQSWERR